jgi:GlpG protein
MNGMWYWELGRRIEVRQGSINLLDLTLLFSLVSNYAQYAYGGPGLFGGLSGVLYGLLGHCWIFQLLSPNPAYRLPRGVSVRCRSPVGWPAGQSVPANSAGLQRKRQTAGRAPA